MNTRGIEEVVLHADAIPEDGAAAERTRGIDGDHADRLVGCAQLADEAIDQRRFAGAGRAGDSERVGASEPRVDPRHDRGDVAGLVLDAGHQLRERDAIAGEHALDQMRVPGCSESRLLGRTWT